ncbi:alpha/beta hydrolase [Ravibacter arvi]|uniref:Alpha/beta hydrolase n=1 Tax=Ravibacter arvi TaxID=2051041 RepID=A0ABP8LRE7_9BACT
MTRLKLTCFITLFMMTGAMAQSQVIPLWPEGQIPNAIRNDIVEKSETDDKGILRISGVTVPTMTVFLPEKSKATGAAVLICPGGGYGILAASHEGSDLARWFNERGIAGVVLKYRLPNAKAMVRQHEVPLTDAMQAMKLIRKNAGEWRIDPDKIGVMGFSAGGHLAATLSTHYHRGEKASEGAKPNFSILMYPVITFSQLNTHIGSRKNLLGPDSSAALVTYYSNELQVDEKTPPAFLVHSEDDKAVPIENSIGYYLALKKYKIPAEAHFYPEGGHGYGLRTDGKGSLAGWPQALENWLKSRGYQK